MMKTTSAMVTGPANVPANATNLATACSLCAHNCGLRVDVENNRIVAVRADESHPATKGYSCNKGYAIGQYVNHDNRVTHPLKKMPDGQFERISWDQAIREIAAKLNDIRHHHAPRAIGIAGMGGQGGHSSGLGALPLMFGIGSPVIFTAIAQEKTQHTLSQRRMMRTTSDSYLIPDKHHAKFILMLGHNPLISNMGHNSKEAIQELVKNPDRRMVVVDPRVTETTRKAHLHLRIKPAKDIFLLMAIAGVIVQEGLEDQAFLQRKTVGYPQIKALFQQVDIAEMARRCELDEQDIRQTARDLATTKPACIVYDLGIEHSSHNTLTSYVIHVCLLLTGNLGRVGGNTFVQLFGPKMPYIRHPAKSLAAGIEASPCVTPMPQFSPALVAEEIEVDHPERLRALILDGANAVATYPDTHRIRRAFAKLDLLVVIDPAMSESAWAADYVLPAATGYEKWDWSIFWKPIMAPQIRPPVVSGPEEALPEVEIYYRLAREMGLVSQAPALLHRLARYARKPWGTPAYLAALGSIAGGSSVWSAIKNGEFDVVGETICRMAFLNYQALGKQLPAPLWSMIWFMTLGYVMTSRDQIVAALPETKSMLNPFLLSEYVFQKLLDNPQGAHIGSFEQERNFEYFCGYKDGKARIYQADFANDLQGLMAADPEPDDPEYPFVLNGGLRTGYSANTIMQDPGWRKGKGPHAALYISPDDAHELGLTAGDQVSIRSRRGCVTAPVRLDPGTRRGHLHLPNMLSQRYPDPSTGELRQTGIPINELGDSSDRDPYTGCPHTKRIRVQIEKMNEQAPGLF
ncbi:MAG TPA: molybdopterin-dependent oxidoreductase [Fluviicoccus sp.]|nr:molybdopterin-dependent oxidoreductase [Fluviicoccus sp.]